MLGDRLDRISILLLKIGETHSADDLRLLEKLQEELKDQEFSPADLLAALTLGTTNGRLWVINDWTRVEPRRFFYGEIQKLNDHRRFQVKALNKGGG